MTKPAPDPEPLPPVRSEALLKGRKVRVIRHGTEEYRLRPTREPASSSTTGGLSDL